MGSEAERAKRLGRVVAAMTLASPISAALGSTIAFASYSNDCTVTTLGSVVLAVAIAFCCVAGATALVAFQRRAISTGLLVVHFLLLLPAVPVGGVLFLLGWFLPIHDLYRCRYAFG